MINEKLRNMHSNTSVFDEDRHNRILEALENRSKMTKEELKACTEHIGNTNAYAWCRNHLKVAVGGKIVLCHKPSDDGKNENADLSKKRNQFVCKSL